MPSVEQSFTAHLYRPYFDLGPIAESAPVACWGVEFACRALLDGRDYPWMYAEYPPSFRERLLEITGLTQYRVYDPRDLSSSLQTTRWQHLCEHLEDYQSLAPVTRLRVVRLLGKLGLYSFLLEFVPPPADSDVQSSEVYAELAYVRALAGLVISEDAGGQIDEHALEHIARYAPPGSHVRILALNHVAVRKAKYSADVDGTAYWLDLHCQEIQRGRSKLGETTYAQLMSRHHRVNAFVPQLNGDRAGVVREMDLCQQYAECMPRGTLEQRIAGDELMYAALESRTKEALWLGDLDVAEQRARRLVELWPLEPLAHNHLGQVLIERERIEDALGAYLSAARISAPGAEAAWFMAGQCYEALKLPERACDAYLAALRLDPLGISSLERFAEVADEIRNPVLASWSRARLSDVEAQASPHEDRQQLAAYQQYEGQLGCA
jgi:hypothetical protein